MTKEMENNLVALIEKIEAEKRVLIREIAAANTSGEEASEAITKMELLAKRKLKLTRPVASVAA